MENLDSYLTKDGWRKDWDETKADFKYLFGRSWKAKDAFKTAFPNKDNSNTKGGILYTATKVVESFCGNRMLHLLPQYRFLFVPLYKLLGGKKRPVIATMGTFTTSAFLHNPGLVGKIADGSADSPDYLSGWFLMWIVSGAAISYVKYKRKKREETALAAESDLEKIATSPELTREEYQ
ncbi:MAG: hypothetical protein V1734_05130 [Nanoarchaeota archaeon]